ncbi:MAG: hypothetical protein JEZ02_19625 [Desulfatibacillum sp.]|nr:hypothetical protein [Desulfatibacillum sp.]
MTIIQPPLPEPRALLNDFFQHMGYPKKAKIPTQIKDIAIPTLERVLKLARPVAMYETTNVLSVSEASILCQGLEISSHLWAELVGKMPEPRTVAVFAMTLGMGLENESARSQEKSMAMGYFMHEAGALVAETAVEAMQGMIKKDPAFAGLAMTRRFSPGYCDWPTEGQKDIFGFLKPERIGISVSSGWGMTPSKSITGAIVFAPKRPYASPCGFCSNTTCDHRRG